MKRILKHTLSVLVAVTMVFGCAPFAALDGLGFAEVSNVFGLKAEAASYSGTCGDSLTWSLDTETGELVISGSGAMKNWPEPIYESLAPWGDYCLLVKTVTIKGSVTSIGNNAFRGCSNLTSITIPDSVTHIGEYAFRDTAYYDDSSNWEDGVLYIGKILIEAKTDISGVYEIKNGTTIIAARAFDGCESLTSIIIPNTVINICNYAFASCRGMTEIIIPNSVKTLGSYAFSSCFSLTDITLPDSITRISKGLFNTCRALRSVTIPNTVTSIGDSAFVRCSGLTSITIPNSVTSIEAGTFAGCSSLKSITLPYILTSIGNFAFYLCDSLTDVYYGGTQKMWDKISIGSYNSELNGATIHFSTVSVVRSVSISDINVNYKSSATLRPTIDADKDALYSFVYSSSDEEVAIVDNNGEVTATGRGTATITCTVTDEYGNEATDTCTVTVEYAWWQWLIVIFLFGWIWY